MRFIIFKMDRDIVLTMVLSAYAKNHHIEINAFHRWYTQSQFQTIISIRAVRPVPLRCIALHQAKTRAILIYPTHYTYNPHASGHAQRAYTSPGSERVFHDESE
jgi:hypothetical protein